MINHVEGWELALAVFVVWFWAWVTIVHLSTRTMRRTNPQLIVTWAIMALFWPVFPFWLPGDQKRGPGA